MYALEYANRQREQIREISQILKSADPVKAVEKVINELKLKQQEVETLKEKLLSLSIDDYIKQAKEIDGVKALAVKLEGVDIKSLRIISDKIREKLHPAVILLASKTDGQGVLVLSVTKDATNTYDAGKLLKEITQAVGGKGGGRTDSAQGGCPDGESIDKAVEIFYQLIKK